MLKFFPLTTERSGLSVGSPLLFPILALGSGTVGFVLRRWQWASAYDDKSELFLNGALSTYALLGLLAAAAIILLLGACKTAPKGKGKSLPRPACLQTGYLMLMVMGGFLFLGAGGLTLLAGMDQMGFWKISGDSSPMSYPATLLLCGGLCLPAGLAVLLLGKNAYRDEDPGKVSLLAVLPPFTLLVWLFATHLQSSTDPVLLRYGVYLFAAVLLLMGHYDVAGLYHGNAHPRRLLFCSWMGTTLVLISLADGLAWYQIALALAAALPLLAQSYALLTFEKTAFKPES